MATAGLRQPLFSSENKPLLWAALIAVSVHALAFWLLFALAIFSILFSPNKRETIAEMLHSQTARARTPQETEPQLIFVQVDPAQPAAEAPKNAKYYSSQNSVAANPDARTETGVPKIDGSQTHVPKAETSFPLRPSQPQPQPQPQQPEKPQPKPAEPVKPGDLAMMTHEAKPAQPQPETPPEHQRPHTLAEARSLAGEKVKEDGGVEKHRVVSSFDAIGSPFGEYDARIIEAIQQHWYDLLGRQSFTQDRVGKVVVEFRLNFDGRITDLHVTQNDVGELLSYLCVAAIRDPAPYERWPEPMYRKIKTESGKDYRDIQFTFFYDQ